VIEQKSLLTELGEAIDRYRAGKRSAQEESLSNSRKTGRVWQLTKWLIPNGGTLVIVALLLVTQSLWARPFAAPNAPGPSATTVNYQGRLADDAGVPLTGTYGMSFALYDAAEDGTLIWGPESHTAVPVSEGLFSVGLGSQTSGGIPTTTWNGDRYLEITVGGETLSPRELIRSVPIAGMALTVPDGAIPNEKLALSYHTITGGPDHFDLTGSEQLWAELTFDLPYDATCIAFVTFTANGQGGRSLLYLRDENGNSLGAVNHTSSSVSAAAATFTFDLPAGQHTLRLTARTASEDVGQEVRGGTSAVIIPLAQTP
jgi:hypothetical protein